MAPSRAHQGISGEIFRQIANYLEGKRCVVYHAPFDVRLFEKDGDAPDMVAEILSPFTQRHDRLVKLGLYQRAGVQEYWIVDPDSQTVQVSTLSDGLLLPHKVYDRQSVAKAIVLDGCFIELSKVFR